MLELWLIRHGETDYNAQGRWQGQTDTPLNALGERQAKALALRLKDVAFDAVYSSDLSRALRTAALALPHHTVIADPRLRELHFGRWEGLVWHQIPEHERADLENWRSNPAGFMPPEGEHFSDMLARIAAWRADLPAQGRLAVVTHGGTLRALFFHLLGLPNSERRWGLALDNCSISRVQISSRTTTILAINDTSHLRGAFTPEGGV